MLECRVQTLASPRFACQLRQLKRRRSGIGRSSVILSPYLIARLSARP